MHADAGHLPPILFLLGILLVTIKGALLLWMVKQRAERRRKTAALNALLAAYRRGDFEAALPFVEGLRDDDSTYRYFQGALLMQIGNLKEAEKLLQQSIQLSEQSEITLRSRGMWAKKALQRRLELTSLRRSTLGQLYLEQGRYDDAQLCFEASLRDWPGCGSSHRAIAETLLRRGGDPTAALKWARLAVDEERASTGLPEEVHSTNLGEQLATLAWSVAVALRDRPQVDRLVSEAESSVGDRLVTSCAQVQYLSALAYSTLGDMERSAHHLDEAARVDRKGQWGREARALAAMGR